MSARTTPFRQRLLFWTIGLALAFGIGFIVLREIAFAGQRVVVQKAVRRAYSNYWCQTKSWPKDVATLLKGDPHLRLLLNETGLTLEQLSAEGNKVEFRLREDIVFTNTQELDSANITCKTGSP